MGSNFDNLIACERGIFSLVMVMSEIHTNPSLSYTDPSSLVPENAESVVIYYLMTLCDCRLTMKMAVRQPRSGERLLPIIMESCKQ